MFKKLTNGNFIINYGKNNFGWPGDVPKFNYDISKWAKDSGIDITTGFTPEIIEKYMTEKVLAKKEAEVQKKKEKAKEKKIEELKEHYYHWGTTKKKEMIQWGMNLGQLPKGDVDEYIKEKRDKILKEIKELGGDIK